MKRWGVFVSGLMFFLFLSQTVFASEGSLDDRYIEITAFNNAINDVQDEAIFKMNEYREKMGLPPFNKHRIVQRASQSHADYLFLNNELGHFQNKSNPGFIGASPWDRALYFGYEARTYSEGITYGAPTGIEGINSLFDAPYHRAPIMNPRYSDVGTGYNENGHLVVNYGNDEYPHLSKENEVIVYPYPDQKDVKVSWLALETPNPLSFWGVKNEDLKVVGYPISYFYPDGYYTSNQLVVEKITLTDDLGKTIPIYDVTPERGSDNNQHVIIIPKQPLAVGMTYHVSVDAHVMDDGDKRDISRKWSFTTMEEVNVTDVYFIGHEDEPDELIVEINNGANVPMDDHSNIDYYITLERNGKTYLSASSERLDQTVKRPIVSGDYTLKVEIPLLRKELILPVNIQKNTEKFYWAASDWKVSFDNQGKDTVVNEIVKTFPDLPDWAKDEIIYLEREGVVTGLPDGTFGSSKTITRGDAAIMLARAKNLDTYQVNNTPTFSDVNKKMYYYGAVEAAVKAGYLSGYPDGKFGPKDTLTREQMAKVIVDAYHLKGNKSSNVFTDISKSWAKHEIELLAQHGITVGTSAGTFKPKANISRAEFSVMLARAMNDEFKID